MMQGVQAGELRWRRQKRAAGGSSSHEPAPARPRHPTPPLHKQTRASQLTSLTNNYVYFSHYFMLLFFAFSKPYEQVFYQNTAYLHLHKHDCVYTLLRPFIPKHTESVLCNGEGGGYQTLKQYGVHFFYVRGETTGTVRRSGFCNGTVRRSHA